MFYILPLHFQTQPCSVLTLYRASTIPPRVPLPLYVRTQHYLIIAGKSYHHSAGPALSLFWSPDQSSSLGHNHRLSPEARRYSGQALTAATAPLRSQSPHGARAKQGCMCRSHQPDPGLLECWRGSISTAAAGRPVQASPGHHGHGPGQPYLLGAAGERHRVSDLPGLLCLLLFRLVVRPTEQ